MSTAVARAPLPDQRLARMQLLQLVRLCLGDGGGQALPALRFRADLDEGYPQREIAALQTLPPDAGNESGLVLVSTPDYCVASTLGPLPEPFVEWVRDLELAGHGALRGFLDLFNHRLNLLRCTMHIALEPRFEHRGPARSVLGLRLAQMQGVPHTLADAASRLPVPVRSWLGMGGLLAGTRRSGAALLQVLRAHLGCPVGLQALVGSWRPIEADQLQQLGRQGRRLGSDSLLGRRCWDPQARVRVRIGPLPYAQALQLMPPRRQHAGEAAAAAPAGAHGRLAGLLRLLLERRHDAEVELDVDPATVPPSHLQAAAPGAAGWLLGRNAWITRGATVRRPVLRFTVAAFEIP